MRIRHPKELIGSLTLQKKMGLLMLAGLTVGLVLLSWLGLQSVDESVERTLHERLSIARVMADRMDATLTFTLMRLEGAADFTGGLPARERFAPVADDIRDDLAKLGISTQNVLLVDRNGKVLQAEPENPSIVGTNMLLDSRMSDALESGKTAISGLVSAPLTATPVVLISAPVFSGSRQIEGALIVSIDMERSGISAFNPTIIVGKTGYTEIVDENGIVLARSRPGFPPRGFEKSDHPGRFAELIAQGQATVGTCHRCHETNSAEMERRQDVLAFAPMSTASWGVAIRQSEEEALAPTQRLQRNLLFLGSILLASMLLLVWAMMQAIVKPIRVLTSDAKRVAAGDFTATTPLQRGDELGQLSMAFHAMTQELTRARDKLVSRYKEAKHKEVLRGQLLTSVINAQEEERKRIARELHDEYGQTLTGLIMSIESLENMAAPLQSELKDKLKNTKLSLIRTLDDVRKLTLRLRPSSLDDLGLPAAVRAYAHSQLGSAGINVKCECKDISERLDPAVETALFRIIQEAINNIIKYAHARNVTIELTAHEDRITAMVEDDGQGFDVESTLAPRTGTKSLGLLGIRERTALLDGTFTIDSKPGHGTRLTVEVPAALPAHTLQKPEPGTESARDMAKGEVR